MHPMTDRVADRGVREKNLERLARAGVTLPKFAQLADPVTIPAGIRRELETVERNAPHPLNLFRVHWNNASDGSFALLPEHVVLPPELTGVEAKIVVLFGNRFPLIGAHKVLAAYACLVPRVVSGEFDLGAQRAVWPSTGNYCRGGVAISRIVGCHGVAVLPEGMSRERFEWLEKWVAAPEDIVRTPGTESNVKEIYDACKVLAQDPGNRIFNQFSEYANYLVHYACTGAAAAHVFESLDEPALRLRAFVSASGSAGTLAAGDYLKEKYGSLTVAVEALECPTLLANGFGEHNIQGIGDKHVPLIHNVMATDAVAAVSDRATDELNVLFNSSAGHELLGSRRDVPHLVVEHLSSLGLSSICNVVAAIKTAKYYRMGASDVILTVATDGASMYRSEMEKTVASDFGGRFDDVDAAMVCGRHLLGAATDHFAELTLRDRERIFNLGYFTWVEQQGVPFGDFVTRGKPSFWAGLHGLVKAWDEMIPGA